MRSGYFEAEAIDSGGEENASSYTQHIKHLAVLDGSFEIVCECSFREPFRELDPSESKTWRRQATFTLDQLRCSPVRQLE